MEVRVLNSLPGNDCPDQDYIRVHTCSAPEDDTVTLATIERITDRTTASRTTKRVRTLLGRRPMSVDAALELATSYAERKQVPIVYAEPVTPGR
ncbi:MAG TPA: hypothetical protein VHH11_17350 [Gammaproteobacteria bacterium]|jgi:hypothetical protein|nr:hypothetical protein [Gammaproteobacteria bacterium]